MIFRHLRYFEAVAEAGSMAGAAASLRIAQPALSRQIQDLETALGTPLFNRHPHGVELTDAGAAAAPIVREILAGLDKAAEETQRSYVGEGGEVRIALAPYAVESPRVTRALMEARGAFPGVVVDARQLQSEGHAAALRAGEIDIGVGVGGGVGGSEDRSLIRSETLFLDPVNCAILPSTHELAHRSTISIRELAGTPFIHFRRTVSRVFPQVTAALEAIGVEIADECDSVSSVRWQVAAGKGWALGLASQMGRAPAGTVVIPFSDFGVETAIVARVRPTDASPLVRRLLDALVATTMEPPRPIVKAPPVGEPAGLAQAVEMRHLEALVAACDEGSLSRGAERVGLTQSGISRRVAALEGLLDAALIERGGSTVIPTIAGRTMLRHARVIIELGNVAFPAAIAGTTRCRLGVVPTKTSELAVIHVIRSLGHETFDVTEMTTAGVEEALREGKIDVGLSQAFGEVADQSIDSLTLGDDAIECALLSSSHHLANAPTIRLSQLANEPFVFIRRDDTPVMYDRVLDSLERVGFRPRVHATADTARALRGMVAAAMGWTVGLRSQREHRESPDLVAIPIEGLSIAAGMRLLWRRGDHDRRTLGVVSAFQKWSVSNPGFSSG